MVLPVREFSAAGYRSLQRIHYPMSRLDVFVGPNGVGKSNLYRGLELLRCAANNTLGETLAREGFDLAMWAGPRRKDPRRIKLAASFSQPNRLDAAYRYEVEVGYPPGGLEAPFPKAPHIKCESLSVLGGGRPVRLMEREGPRVMARGEDGRPQEIDIDILESETVLGRLENPSLYPTLDLVRRTLLEWRFYHGLRTDADSPLRKPGMGVPAATLASDGSNLAAVFATLAEIRADTGPLDEMIDQAFPGAVLAIAPAGRTTSFGMTFPEFPQRLFEAAELSDGTLRFLGLAGALMAYRLPAFIALNEPESSLHPDLMAPLAKMIVWAAQRTQVWLVTHSERLAKAIEDTGEGVVRHVAKVKGATTIEGLTLFGTFRDEDDEDEEA
jgi:predicted ATPase